MAIEVQVSAVTVLVTSEPKERMTYEYQGDKKVPKGRLADADGRPLTGVSAVVVCEPLGMLGEAQVLLPDVQARALAMGAIVRVEGSHVVAKLTGGDFASIRATITGERVSPVGQWLEWVAGAGRPSGKPSDTRAA